MNEREINYGKINSEQLEKWDAVVANLNEKYNSFFKNRKNRLYPDDPMKCDNIKEHFIFHNDFKSRGIVFIPNSGLKKEIEDELNIAFNQIFK